jgi:hypothetical protein
MALVCYWWQCVFLFCGFVWLYIGQVIINPPQGGFLLTFVIYKNKIITMNLFGLFFTVTTTTTPLGV